MCVFGKKKDNPSLNESIFILINKKQRREKEGEIHSKR